METRNEEWANIFDCFPSIDHLTKRELADDDVVMQCASFDPACFHF